MPPSSPSPLRAVVDTNIIVRGVLSPTGGSALILQAIKRRRCIFITSRHHLTEVFGVLSRPRMYRRYGITALRLKRLVARIAANAVVVSPQARLHMCRDPKDDYLIELALLGQATHLITEDADLHEDADIRALLEHFKVRLVRAEQFLLDLARTLESTS